MSGSLQKPWSDDSNAPQVPLSVYHGEKTVFAGTFIALMFYGIVIHLFFQCTGALFNTVNHPRGVIKWPLVAHTVTMFSILTVIIAVYLEIQTVTNIDNRTLSGDGSLPFPGPLIYQDFIYSKANGVVLATANLLNAFLADGLLLCRCYVVYSRNYWIVAFPCLMYLASLAVGITFIYQGSRSIDILWFLAPVIDYEVPYYSISFALNIILSLMIVTRLFLLHRNIRNAMNAPVRVNGLYRVIVTSLIESCALYSVTLMLLMGSWAARSQIWGVVTIVIPQIQAIASFLITIQIANQGASTNVTIASGTVGSFRFVAQGELASGEGIYPDGCLAGSTDMCGETPPGPSVAVETTADLHHDN